jgi:ubiquinone/menaquinone biosynthesis C-methylase UbiE
VQPFSSCCWWLLGQLVTGLRLRPDDTLVDLGCGRGGPGLWLARALSTQLVALDFSPEAVELTAARAQSFLPADRATFQVGTFDATGLPPATAHGVVSIDALPFAPDRDAAVAEARRILAPGGRLVFTAGQRHEIEPGSNSNWERRLTDAGFEIETRTVHPCHHEHWRRLYALWQEHADGLRRELGEDVTAELLAEAERPNTFEAFDSLVLVCRRDLDSG